MKKITETPKIIENELAPIENIMVSGSSSMSSLTNNDFDSPASLPITLFGSERTAIEERIGRKLLSHVVKGEEAQALEMIRNNPALLLQTAEAFDYSNRHYKNYTPFQAALLCHDIKLWKKMETYLNQLPDGLTKKSDQFKMLFPDGILLGKPYDFSALVQIITFSSNADIHAALIKEQNETAICNILHHFRGEFTVLAMQETFFNPSHLIEALKIFNEKNWSEEQRDLFWRQVIGFTQRFVPAYYAQVFVQGLDYIAERKNQLELSPNFKIERSLKFKLDSGHFFPLEESSGLGFDFAICPGAPVKTRTGGSTLNMVIRLQKVYAKELNQLESRVREESAINMNNPTPLKGRSWCAIS